MSRTARLTFRATFRATILALAGLFAVLQLLPGPRPTNAVVVPGHTLRANLHVTPQVSAVLARACENCHSQTTKWPWYSHVAPISWQLVKDVDRARKVMDFSEWSTHLGRRPQIAASALLACCSDLERKRMPSGIYLLLHPEARLTVEERRLFCEWSIAEASRLLRTRSDSSNAEFGPVSYRFPRRQPAARVPADYFERSMTE